MTIQPPSPTTTTPRLDPRRGTSVAAWAAILAVVAALIVARLPQLELLVTERTSALLVDLGDPELGAASVRVGAITALVLFVVVSIAIAVAVGLLERWLGPAAHAPRPWLRIGVGGAVVAIVGIGLQLAAVVLSLPSVAKSLPVLLVIVAVGAVAPLAFPAARGRAAYVRAAGVGVVAGVLLWLQ
ncbi:MULTISPECIES: hypothetical protein [unclassified Agrococcus]|uniref:hypothetical protein n=1 Tax=unclassified Agrococcus TaxID=2615065 RepID=UPI003621B44F